MYFLSKPVVEAKVFSVLGEFKADSRLTNKYPYSLPYRTLAWLMIGHLRGLSQNNGVIAILAMTVSLRSIFTAQYFTRG